MNSRNNYSRCHYCFKTDLGGKNVNLPIKPVWNSHMQDVKDENLKWMKNETLCIEGSSVSESWEKLLTGLFSAER